MFGQQGKATLMSLIVVAIIFIGGFMAFKFIGTGMEKKQIKKEVFDTLGSTRGADRENEQLEAIIESILEKRNVEILEIHAELEKSVIHYTFSYRILIDYLLFKRSEVVTVEDQIENYG
jgi:hypothetical protein